MSEKKALKSEYDRKRRCELSEKIATEKREYFRRNRARLLEQMKEARSTPEYKRRRREYLSSYWSPERLAQKKDYDRKFRARKKFGRLWEIHYLTVLLNEEVKSRMSNYEIRLKNGTLNKTLMRSRNGEIKRSYS